MSKSLLEEARIHAAEHPSKDVRYFARCVVDELTKRDEAIRLCEKALESMGVLATAIQQHPDFDGEFNEAPTPLLYIVGKTLLGVNEALAAIEALPAAPKGGAE